MDLDVSSSSTSSSSSSSSVSSSSSSSGEEILRVMFSIQRRFFRDRSNPFEQCDDVEFHLRYRLSKQTVTKILHAISSNIEPATHRNESISALNQLLTALRFLSTGAYQIVVADDMKIHKSSVCRIVKKVVPIIAALGKNCIRMPKNKEEADVVKAKFQTVYGFPLVLGCVDGVHIRMQSPGGGSGELYRNPNGFFSYNVQIICDADLLIRDIDVTWPGSTQDSTVFDACQVRVRFEQKEFPDCFLLGDAALPCRNYLLTPVLNPATEARRKYNKAHARTMTAVAKTLDAWKRRFPSLVCGMRNTLATTRAAIVAAAVLHNIAIEEGDELPNTEEDSEVNNDSVETKFFEPYEENAARTKLINTVFGSF